MSRITITVLMLATVLLPMSAISRTPPRDIVYNMFNEVLKRNPTPEEFDIYMDLVIENGWDNSDLKEVLRQKKRDAKNRAMYGDNWGDDYDYDRPHLDRGFNRHSERDYWESRRWIESSFDQHLGRLPTRREMERYCEICLDKDYSRNELSRRISDDYRGERRYRGSRYNERYDYERYASEAEVEYIIEEIFRDELRRDVDHDSMRKYRRLMIDEGWSERRVREDLAHQPQMSRMDLEKVVVRAYEDLLDKRPSTPERDRYVELMLNRHWDERKLRDSIKRSREYTYDRPRNLIKKAYQNVLLREAEAAAFNLSNTIVSRGWNLEDIENHLRKSAEYRDHTIPKMLHIAYKELLDREPDDYGIGFYTKRAMEGWTFEDIKTHIRASDEYASRGTGK